MYDIILSFVTAFTLTYFAIPSIINIAVKKNLVDLPDERKAHTTPTPSLGGIGIFAGVIFSIVMWTPFHVFGDLQYLLCSFIIVFLVGAKDDILPMAPWKKLAGEILAAGHLGLKVKRKTYQPLWYLGRVRHTGYCEYPILHFCHNGNHQCI